MTDLAIIFLVVLMAAAMATCRYWAIKTEAAEAAEDKEFKEDNNL